jgi:hypothetical protein
MFVVVGITAAFYGVGSSSTILLLNMSNETSLLPLQLLFSRSPIRTLAPHARQPGKAIF